MTFKSQNGDAHWTDNSGLYAKGLVHSSPGIPDAAVFNQFTGAIATGQEASSLPVSPPLFEPNPPSNPSILGGGVKLNGPQAAFARQPFGPQSPAVPTAIPPTVGDPAYAVELAELYWASLLRDVPFTEFTDTTTNPLIQAAAKDLTSNVQYYRGPVTAEGKVTPSLLFRGGLRAGMRAAGAPAYFAGETVGPYMSQFCITPTALGVQPISQMMRTNQPGQDFMTSQGDWYKVQQGIATGKSLTADPIKRFMRDGRALAAFTHEDELYQAYLVAYLVLKTWEVSANAGSPYGKYVAQQPFGTFGGPDIASTLGAVARAAINAVWYQKWAVNLRHRPEAGAGLVHLRMTGAATMPQAAAAFTSEFLAMIKPSATASAQRYSGTTATTAAGMTYLLSQAFPEGSPPHPAYPTGHGAVAGACITALKFFFNCDQPLQAVAQPMVPAEDGLSLMPYEGADAGQMTITGELHKLAHNITFGHGIHGGIHWRSDSDESIIFGEQVAINYLQALSKTYAEPFKLSITTTSGTQETFNNP